MRGRGRCGLLEKQDAGQSAAMAVTGGRWKGAWAVLLGLQCTTGCLAGHAHSASAGGLGPVVLLF